MTNYKAVTKRIIKELIRQGFALVGAYDGEETLKTDNATQAANHIDGTGQGSFEVKKGEFKVNVGIMFGNTEQETVYDHTISRDEATAESFEKAYDNWSKSYN
tara:strand:- start:483 stop:791 length:309 start_codon:yes stop_codon:yes gene_type:complete